MEGRKEGRKGEREGEREEEKPYKGEGYDMLGRKEEGRKEGRRVQVPHNLAKLYGHPLFLRA
jgi:hypothetical protein